HILRSDAVAGRAGDRRPGRVRLPRPVLRDADEHVEGVAGREVGLQVEVRERGVLGEREDGAVAEAQQQLADDEAEPGEGVRVYRALAEAPPVPAVEA